MSKTLPKFQQAQYEFTAHIRDPEHKAAPKEIEDRRMKIYRDLFYNNIEGFIADGFPVLRKLYDDNNWHQLVRSFFSTHESHSPYFLEISEEFLQYLQNEHKMRACDPPYLLELAHYEWVELALMVADETNDLSSIDPNGDLLQKRPAISSLAWLLSYQWPVHEIDPNYRAQEPPAEATHIFVYRDRKDKVRFVQLNPITTRLIYLLQTDTALTGMDAIKRIIDELKHPNPQVVIDGGGQALEELRQLGIILGTYTSQVGRL